MNNNKPLMFGALALIAGACGQKTEEPRPNILFFIEDDASFNHYGAAGCSWINTPAFDRVAQDGVFFQNCYTPNAKSAPSRAVLLTGRYSWQLESSGNHITNFSPNYKVFTEALSDGGYATGFTGKGWAPGDPGMRDGKPRLLTGEPFQARKTTPPARFISDTDYSANFCDFLDSVQEGQPWFFWVGTREPHRKYEYGAGVAKGGKSIDQIEHVPAYWPDNEIVRNDMLDYGYEIEYADKHLGIILDELDKRDLLDNTIVIVTADNGMPFPRAKANNYEQSHHQPLAIMWGKGIKHPGRAIADYVNFVDVAPTILDAAGISFDESGMSEFAGESILPLLLSDRSGQITSNRDHLIFGRERDDYGRPLNQGYPIRGIIRDHLLYIWNVKPELYPACDPEIGYCEIDGSPTKSVILDMHRDGSDDRYYQLSMGFRPEEELYDIIADPDCMNNLSELPSYAQAKATLKAELLKTLTSQGDPRVVGGGDIFDQYPYQYEQDWNFYEKVKSGEIARPWEITDWINPSDYDEYVDKVRSGEIEPMGEITKGLNW